MRYKIIAIIGKAGSGKDTILKELIKQYPNLHEIVSCTTRPKREKETEGVDYFFLSDEQFADKILNDEFLECTLFNNWGYGTSLDSVMADKINVGVFNPAGIDILKEDPRVNLTVFQIEASDKSRLLRQLNREENPNVAEIIRRYKTDESDFNAIDFDKIILSNENQCDINYCVKYIADFCNVDLDKQD